jgi:GntR family transcriptional regulator
MMSFADLIGRLPESAAGPLYLQFQQAVRRAIGSGLLAAGEALPSERELCEDFGISRITVRRAIGGLVDEGHLIRRHGAGTFVADPGAIRERVEKNFSKLSSFSEDMAARGYGASSTWLSRSKGSVTPDEALALALSPGSPVYRFRRLRLADGRPMAVEHSTIAGYCLPSLDAVTDSLYRALDDAGHRPTRALQRLRALAFPPEPCELLQVEPGHAGLMIERRGFLRDGRAAEFTLSYYRGDAYDFVAELGET